MSVAKQGQESVPPAPRATGVSVITATVGRSNELRRKASALAQQSLPIERWEWIVAFDGPRPDLARELAAVVGHRLTLRTVEIDRSGPGPARDAAARLARHSVLYLSDDDCLPDRGVLERHLDAQQDPAVYLGSVAFDDGERVRETHPPKRPHWWNLGGANASIPTETFFEVGGFGSATVGYGGEDLWLGRRLALRGVPFRSLDGAGVLHLGPDPQLSGDTERARHAGANAVRLARVDRGVSWRLGVHPWLLAIKKGWFASPVTGLDPNRLAYERAYADGARRAWEGRVDGEPRNDALEEGGR